MSEIKAVEEMSFREALHDMMAGEISPHDPVLLLHADGTVQWIHAGHLEGGERYMDLDGVSTWIYASEVDYDSDPDRYAAEVAADADVRAAFAEMMQQD